MASRDLGIDPAGVHGAAAMVRAVPGRAPSGGGVTPCADDCVSVAAANWLASLMAALDHAIAAADQEAEAAAARLQASAGAYQQQELLSAANLGGTGAGSGRSVGIPAVVPASLPIPLVPPVGGGGIQPASGRQAAELIRRGRGPQAPKGLDDTAMALHNRGERLDHASALVRAARDQVGHSWQSAASEAALTGLARLESRYARLAADARHLAGKARALAELFRKTDSQMPDLHQWDETTARLKAAVAANSSPASLGTLGPAIKHYTVQLAAYSGKSWSNFADYEAAGVAHAAPGLPGETELGHGGITGPGGAGELQPGTAARLNRAAANPGDRLSNPLMGGAAGGAGKIMETVVPAVVTGVTGGIGGLLGAVTGATSQLGGMTGQLASGLAQTASSAAGGAHPAGGPGEHSGGSGQHPGGSPGGGKDDAKGPGGGGGGGHAGDTEPASAPAGPLVAPASATGVPATAAPASAAGLSAAAPPASGQAMTGAPMGGGMMSPMMGGGPMGGGQGGGGGGEAERQLYAERRLRIETPPNSEPVKGRRETRRSRDDRPRE